MARKKAGSASAAKGARTDRTKTKKPAKKKAARPKKAAAKASVRIKGGASAFRKMVNAANNLTSNDIVTQARAAANEFNGPIQKLGNIQQPNQGEISCLTRMQDKQAEIMEQAAKQILNLPAMAQALDRLRTATTNLNGVAQQMVDVTAVLQKANKLLGFGTDAVNAIKSVTG